MSRFAVIERVTNRCINVIEWDSAQSWQSLFDTFLYETADGGVGWAFDGVKLILPIEDPALVAERARLVELEADAAVAEIAALLEAATLTQISTYVDTQITDLASARALFKRILAVLCLLLKDRI